MMCYCDVWCAMMTNVLFVMVVYDVLLRESHAVILRDRVVPASQVPFPGEPSGEPGKGPDEPGQLCTEEMTAWDSFSHP